MESGALQDRLSSDAKAFDGLLSLIPSKLYYGEDTSDQWKKKKQSKAEARAARRGKLDPDSALNRNAKEVMDERAKKRKLEEMSDDGESQASTGADTEGIEKEAPGEGLQKHEPENPAKKQKVSKAKQAKKAEKRIKAQEKRAEKRKAKESKTAGRQDITSDQPAAEPSEKDEKPAKTQPATEFPTDKPSAEEPAARREEKKEKKEKKALKKEVKNKAEIRAPEGKTRGDLNPMPEPTQELRKEEQTKPAPQSSPDSGPASPTFDKSSQQGPAEGDRVSIDTSANESNADGSVPKRAHIKVPDQERMAIFREKLHAKLASFREARGAGPDGKPVRSREDLIEARRLEQAKKKAHKKELRLKAKEEQDRQREEALKAASSRSSPLGSMSPSVHGDTSFSFGRVAFSDGAQMSRDLTYVLKNDRKKGPSDPKTALAKLENQKVKMAAMDEDKRKEVLEKETWLAARKRAEGEKIRNDETLLKKAVKRKEKAKKKSEKEWKTRAKGVEQAMKTKQQKRENNLRKRREEKALGKLGKKKKSKANKKTKARPGFEGAFSLGRK